MRSLTLLIVCLICAIYVKAQTPQATRRSTVQKGKGCAWPAMGGLAAGWSGT